MTEAEWLACGDLDGVIVPLLHSESKRKWRCFALACVRLIWHLLTPGRQRAVEVSERYLDGHATNSERSSARQSVSTIPGKEWNLVKYKDGSGRKIVDVLYWAMADQREIIRAAQEDVPNNLFTVVGWDSGEHGALALDRILATTLHEIFGNPFRLVSQPSASRIPQTLSLAQSAYDERILPSGHLDNTHLSILADALEEAGRTDEAILAHLRSPGPHVRGCWALDLILGKS